MPARSKSRSKARQKTRPNAPTEAKPGSPPDARPEVAPERRADPRVSLPLLVELSHASFGTRTVTATDLSDGGLFVNLTEHSLAAGAQLKVRMTSSSVIEIQNTPTVDVNVVRIEDGGIALAFKNKTAAHLWGSVERLRQELLVGRDFLQLYAALALVHPTQGFLLVQERGKWTIPGCYLDVDSIPETAIADYCAEHLADSEADRLSVGEAKPFAVRMLKHPVLPEATTFCCVFTADIETARVRTKGATVYKDRRWINKEADLKDVTIAHPWVREICEALLARRQAQIDD